MNKPYVLKDKDLLFLDKVNISSIKLCKYHGNYYRYYMIFMGDIYYRKCYGMLRELPEIIIF